MLPEQVSLMDKGDLWGWMESLHRIGSNDPSLPYQMHFFDETLEDALALIKGHKPRILTLVQECFEASLLLLQERFPRFISPRVTQYIRSHEQRNHVKRTELLNTSSRASLRDHAKVWFSDDFVFYDAAVKQFRRHLLSSTVNTSIVEQCFRNLDKKEAEPVLGRSTQSIPLAQTDYHRFDLYDWNKLPTKIQNAMTTLGYSKHIWDDTNVRPPAFQKYWDDLTEEEKKAAKEIGYQEEEWDD
jgi:hypothetical protein